LDKKDDIAILDLFNLTAFSYRSLDDAFKGVGVAEGLHSSGRASVQLLFNEVFSLPTTRMQDGTIVADLPKAKLLIPREKPLPQAKPLTKWQLFAQRKGIQPKRKRSKLEWDESQQEWRRRHGYKRVNDIESEWVKEVKTNDPNAHLDPWTVARQERKERVDQQKKREMKNKQKAEKQHMKHNSKLWGIPEHAKSSRPTQKDFKDAIATVNKATASVGVFNEMLPKEAPVKERGRRRFDAVTSTGGGTARAESEKNLKLLNRVLGKEMEEDVLDPEKAANLQIMWEQKHGIKNTLPDQNNNNKKKNNRKKRKNKKRRK